MTLTDTEQAKYLTEFFENLTPKQQKRLFVIMFNKLQIQEFVDCYLEDEDDPEVGQVTVYWECTGEDLKEDLHAYL